MTSTDANIARVSSTSAFHASFPFVPALLISASMYHTCKPKGIHAGLALVSPYRPNCDLASLKTGVLDDTAPLSASAAAWHLKQDDSIFLATTHVRVRQPRALLWWCASPAPGPMRAAQRNFVHALCFQFHVFWILVCTRPLGCAPLTE